VTNKLAEEYNSDDIDEVECPHCNGACQTGLVGDICKCCRGDGYVSHQAHDEYTSDDIDEVECPHCNGVGQKGLCGSLCT